MTGVSQAPLRVGVVGADVIATAPYGVLPNLPHIAGKAVVTAVADIVSGRAQEVARAHGIPSAYDTAGGHAGPRRR